MKRSASSAETVASVRVLAGRPAPSYGVADEGVLARREDVGSIPENAVLIMAEDFDDLVPGEALPGWTEGVYAQSDDVPPGGGRGAAMVNTNIPAAYYRFPAVTGILTVELWLKPHPGDTANCGLYLGNDSRGWVSADGSYSPYRRPLASAAHVLGVVGKRSDGAWWYASGALGRGGLQIPIEPYDGEWRHLKVRYDTAQHQYDLYMDHKVVARNVPSSVDLSGGISSVSLQSGRWRREVDETSCFDDLRVYVEPSEHAVTREEAAPFHSRTPASAVRPYRRPPRGSRAKGLVHVAEGG